MVRGECKSFQEIQTKFGCQEFDQRFVRMCDYYLAYFGGLFVGCIYPPRNWCSARQAAIIDLRR